MKTLNVTSCSRFFSSLESFLDKCVISFIGFYQKGISPLFPSCCRYHPTCSAYGLEAVKRFGWRKGLFLLGKRLVKCHPFTGAKTVEVDPVPDCYPMGFSSQVLGFFRK